MHHMITSSSVIIKKKHPRSILKILKSPKLAAFGHLEAGDWFKSARIGTRKDGRWHSFLVTNHWHMLVVYIKDIGADWLTSNLLVGFFIDHGSTLHPGCLFETAKSRAGVGSRNGDGSIPLGTIFFQTNIENAASFAMKTWKLWLGSYPQPRPKLQWIVLREHLEEVSPLFFYRKIDGFRSSAPARLFCSKRRWHM